VGSASSAPERSLWFTFGTHEQLLSVISVSRDVSAQAISHAFSRAQETLISQAGRATTNTGGADAQALARGLLRQASSEFRFENYYAVQRVANMGSAYVFTEEYRSLPD